jgi:hypothetical protein
MSKYCQNDMKCLTDKLINNLNDLGSKVPDKIEKENFFNFSELFSGPVDKDGSLPTSMDLVNPSIPSSSDIKISKNFPPLENEDQLFGKSEKIISLNKMDSSEQLSIQEPSFQDAAKVVEPKLDITKIDTNKIDTSQFDTKKMDNSNIDNSKIDNSKTDNKNFLLNSIFSKGKCNFFNSKCPDNSLELGNFSVDGIDNISLKCGNIKDTIPAKAIAHIKNNNIYEIIIINKGEGYLHTKPPKIIIKSRSEEKGYGATAEAVVDENGYLTAIKVINPGYAYTETPNILIEPPYMNSSCHLCCNL